MVTNPFRHQDFYDGYPYAGAAPVSVQNAFNLALYQRDGWAPWNDYCTWR